MDVQDYIKAHFAAMQAAKDTLVNMFPINFDDVVKGLNWDPRAPKSIGNVGYFPLNDDELNENELKWYTFQCFVQVDYALRDLIVEAKLADERTCDSYILRTPDDIPNTYIAQWQAAAAMVATFCQNNIKAQVLFHRRSNKPKDNTKYVIGVVDENGNKILRTEWPKEEGSFIPWVKDNGDDYWETYPGAVYVVKGEVILADYM